VKKEARELLRRRDLEAIADLAGRRSRLLNVLLALTFDRDPLVGWRSVEAMGVAARRMVEGDPSPVREHMRRLVWLLSEESGGVCWRAPEALAEIVRACPDHFADYAPIVVHLLDTMAEEDLDHFRPGVLWGIGRLGALAIDAVGSVLPRIEAALDHAEPQVRGMAAWCLGEVGRTAPLAARVGLLQDEGPVATFRDGDLVNTTVGALATGAVS
jgi:hypothetical protein